MEVSRFSVHGGALLDEEGGHLGEHYGVDDGAEPDGK